MRSPVRSKQDMYRRLAAGGFGNTSPMWLDHTHWACTSPDLPLWGVRSLVAGGPCRLDVPTHEVFAECRKVLSAGYDYQISAMVDSFRTAVFNVWDSPTGLVVEGVEWPGPDQKWRQLFSGPHAKWSGVAAKMVLRRHMNENSWDDFNVLLEQYPGHVYEMTTMNICFGTVPHRNTVLWEVRDGTFGY
jgi:hypothetical protein